MGKGYKDSMIMFQMDALKPRNKAASNNENSPIKIATMSHSDL